MIRYRFPLIKIIRIFLYLFIFLIFRIGFCEESKSPETVVTLSTQVSSKTVPLNREVKLIIRLSWEGEINHVEIGEVEEPVLTNFEIIGTATSNKVTNLPEGKRVIKEIIYNLQPKTLGMGYVETVRLNYSDILKDQNHTLHTERISIEVISPVQEKGHSSLSTLWMVFVVLIVFIIIIILVLVKIKEKKKRTEPEEEKIVLEEKYLNELKNKVDLKTSDRSTAFIQISKLLRQYIADKFDISALEVTTKELLEKLQESSLDENILKKCELLFTKADLVKFSGQEAEQSELDEIYTTVETIFESTLIEIQKKEHEENVKRKKHKKNKNDS